MSVVFYLNGKKVQLYKPDPLTTLFEYLRQRKLYGTRVSDGNGAFGCDVVTIVSWDHQQNKAVFKSVGALHYPLVYCHGKQIYTVEGIGNKQMLHPIQQQFLECESFQCGFCAGGFTMSMYTLLRQNARPTEANIMQALDGNMCRCTAFNPIAAAVSAFSVDIEEGEMPICKKKVQFNQDIEPAFPQELKDLQVFDYEHEVVSQETGEQQFGVKYFAPKSLDELKHAYKAGQYSNIQLISGSSSHQLRTVCDNYKSKEYVLISLQNVKEFKQVSHHEKKVELGAQLTYSDVMDHFKGKSSTFAKKLVETLVMFHNTPLRNTETIGAGIVKRGDNDLNLILAALNAHVQLFDTSLQVFSQVPIITLLNQQLEQGKIITKVMFEEPEFYFFTKRQRRHANAEALVGCCVVELNQQLEIFVNNLTTTESIQVQKLNITKEEFLAPQDHHQMKELIKGMLAFDLTDNSDARFYGKYKSDVTSNNVFLAQTRYKLDHNIAVDPEYHAALTNVEEQVYGKQLKMPRTERIIPQSYKKIVGHPITSQTLKSKLLGDPIYSADLDEFTNTVSHGAYVMTDRSFGKIISIDIEEAKKVIGFIDYVDERDIPNKVNGNTHSGIQFDTPVFVAKGNVMHMSQPIGLITATTRDAALKAAKLVKVKYDNDDKAVYEQQLKSGKVSLTVAQAIKNNSYLPGTGVGDRIITLGNVEQIEKADFIIEGENFMHGQDHAYFETHNCICYPLENGGMKVFSSTQNPSKMQFDIAWNLNNPNHGPADHTQISQHDFVKNAQIEVEVMALGGGFGGKQDRPMILCTAAAVAAHKTGLPVKLILNRNQDLVTMGGRHPYYFKYKAGFTSEGKYVGMDLLLVNDGGSSFDCSGPVLDKSIFQSQSCYTIPNMKVEGRCAKTNRVTNTAYRGFGAPQATYVQETILDHAIQVWYDKYNKKESMTFSEAAHQFRVMNLNKPGDLMASKTLMSTQYAEHLTQTLYKTLAQRSQIDKLFKEVEEFNKKSKHIKRGISFNPLKNSVNFEENFMNQASVLIHIYRDGSVALSHSGIEMGQSLHTKMAMVCAESLQIPLEYVRVINTNTMRCPNTQPTAASSGADINGKAVKMAADELLENLAELRGKLKDKTWPELCNIAYFNRIRLTAQAFAVLPKEIEWHWPTHEGCTGFYTAYGICLAMVEVNGLTGEFKTLKTYVQKDVGSPLNPLVDCGQIEGGFGMGLGLLTTEEILWEEGVQTTTAKNYAIQSMADVPQFMSVEIQKEVPNPANIHDSKASAESPTCLGAAVYFAIKNAIRELRIAYGKPVFNGQDVVGNKYMKTIAPLSYRKILEHIEE
ncbi:Xanthine_oxidase / Xanthine dehydrogenase [Hexamita inflata]|uniref:Xanthine oxidase / Xanthine dehydrogenase n=1 Tax=Hexamita inflata TaxID=28002 RepID=A0AA86UU29_9EUKA|nr:Xanthine oxidase / Xanthine dehydrogenase [Hexamita inflata]